MTGKGVGYGAWLHYRGFITFKPSTRGLTEHGFYIKCKCKIGVAGLWSYKENEGEEGNRLMWAPFLQKHHGQAILDPQNVQACSRANIYYSIHPCYCNFFLGCVCATLEWFCCYLFQIGFSCSMLSLPMVYHKFSLIFNNNVTFIINNQGEGNMHPKLHKGNVRISGRHGGSLICLVHYHHEGKVLIGQSRMIQRFLPL